MFTQETTREALDALYSADLSQIWHAEFAAVGFDFEEIAVEVKNIIDDIKKIDEHQDNILMTNHSEDTLKNIANSLISQVIQPAINFIVKDNPNSTQQYEDIKKALATIKDNFINIANVLLIQIDMQNLTPAKIKLEIEELKNFKKESKKTLDDLNTKKEEAEQIVRQASGIHASETFSQIFKDQADEHSKFAQNWLNASIGTFCFLILLIIFLFYGWWPFQKFVLDNQEISNPYYSVQAIVFKLLLLSSAYFILHQCVKNYKINRHLYVTNKHRQNALTVYPTISVAGEDVDTRNVVVSQAAKSIFEQMPSGYLDFDDDPRPVNPTAIINKIIDKKT